jgi:hypothetical protein
MVKIASNFILLNTSVILYYFLIKKYTSTDGINPGAMLLLEKVHCS